MLNEVLLLLIIHVPNASKNPEFTASVTGCNIICCKRVDYPVGFISKLSFIHSSDSKFSFIHSSKEVDTFYIHSDTLVQHASRSAAAVIWQCTNIRPF